MAWLEQVCVSAECTYKVSVCSCRARGMHKDAVTDTAWFLQVCAVAKAETKRRDS